MWGISNQRVSHRGQSEAYTLRGKSCRRGLNAKTRKEGNPLMFFHGEGPCHGETVHEVQGVLPADKSMFFFERNLNNNHILFMDDGGVTKKRSRWAERGLNWAL